MNGLPNAAAMRGVADLGGARKVRRFVPRLVTTARLADLVEPSTITRVVPAMDESAGDARARTGA